MEIRKLRHVMIVCHARTGGTWLGQVLNTDPGVKYLWEPNAYQQPVPNHIPNWRVEDDVEVWCRVYLFRPHLAILPEFAKGEMRTAVYKLHTVLGDVARPGVKWTRPLFERIRYALDAQVIHLVRHPVRWAASMRRWMPSHLNDLTTSIYTDGNAEFWEHYAYESWYRLVRHEDVVGNRAALSELMEWCGLEATSSFDEFVGEMNAADIDTSKQQRTTVMTVDTLLNRWRELPEKILGQMQHVTARWKWAGYAPLNAEVLA